MRRRHAGEKPEPESRPRIFARVRRGIDCRRRARGVARIVTGNIKGTGGGAG